MSLPKENIITIKYNSNLNSCQSLSEIKQFFTDIYWNAPKEAAGLDILFGLSNLYEQVDPSQETIGKLAGKLNPNLASTRTYMSRRSTKWVRQGIIIKIRRFNNTSIYILNPILFDKQIRKMLQKLFKAFRWQPKIPVKSITLSQFYYDVKNKLFQFRHSTLYNKVFSSLNIYFKNPTAPLVNPSTNVEENGESMKAKTTKHRKYKKKIYKYETRPENTALAEKVRENLHLLEQRIIAKNKAESVTTSVPVCTIEGCVLC